MTSAIAKCWSLWTVVNMTTRGRYRLLLCTFGMTSRVPVAWMSMDICRGLPSISTMLAGRLLDHRRAFVGYQSTEPDQAYTLIDCPVFHRETGFDFNLAMAFAEVQRRFRRNDSPHFLVLPGAFLLPPLSSFASSGSGASLWTPTC